RTVTTEHQDLSISSCYTSNSIQYRWDNMVLEFDPCTWKVRCVSDAFRKFFEGPVRRKVTDYLAEHTHSTFQRMISSRCDTMFHSQMPCDSMTMCIHLEGSSMKLWCVVNMTRKSDQ
ncbi:unnamed protein product, partial [Durusdinium trenchii]